MTVDEFLIWSEGRPGRHELVDGRIYAMSPERVLHGDVKFAVQTALKGAIKSAGLNCFMLPDGMTVRVDKTTAFEPDALVYCGQRLAKTAVEVPDPVIVVEVLSPNTGGYDKTGKLIGYFRLSSIQHYVIVDPDHGVLVHHRREGDAIATRIVGMGTIHLDPPGIEMDVTSIIDPE